MELNVLASVACYNAEKAPPLSLLVPSSWFQTLSSKS